MNKYPRLSEMGVLHPQQIVRYAINSFNNIDHLMIVYSRPKGSLLPVTRTYEFPRIQKTAKAKGSGEDYVVMESSPAFREAEKELKEVMANRSSQQGIADAMHEELRHLEEDFALHIASLKALIAQIKEK